MNLAVESDDADPELRDAARQAMMRLIGLFERIIAEGMKRGEFAKGNARARARLIVASVEGAIMLTNLYKDATYMEVVLDHHPLRDESLVAPFATMTWAPNFWACAYARPVRSRPEMPVGNPR